MKSGINSVSVPIRSFILFCKPFQNSLIVICNQQSTIIGMAVRMSKECNKSILFSVIPDHSVEINIEYRIGIQKKKVFRQLILYFEKRTGIAKRLFFIKIFNMYAKLFTVTKVVHNDMS